MAGRNKYIDADKVFAHVDRIAAWRAGDKPAPVTIEWDLSNRCSRGCSFCHFAYTHTRGPLANSHQKPAGATSGGDLADTALVMRALGETAQAGVQGVIWTGGGEPTLHPDFDLIAHEAARVGVKQGMYTHGGHIGESRARLIRETFTWVVVSLDRHTEATYRAYKGNGFHKSCDGVRRLTAVPGACVVGVSFLLDSESWHDAPAMLELARSLGAEYTTFRPMVQFDQADPAEAEGDRSWVTAAEPMLRALGEMPDVACDADRFLAYRDWTGRSYDVCYGIRMSTTITPDGRVWLCPNRREFPDSSIGDLREESFAAVWARHPGEWRDFRQCRVMCRLHLMNEALAAIETPRAHVEFV
jgi:MoaA/NifB/PqqE/SkfB family radical SAM enzyme